MRGKYDVLKARDQTLLPRDDANFPFLPSKSMSFVFANSEKDHGSDNDYGLVDDLVDILLKSPNIYTDVPRHQN